MSMTWQVGTKHSAGSTIQLALICQFSAVHKCQQSGYSVKFNESCGPKQKWDDTLDVIMNMVNEGSNLKPQKHGANCVSMYIWINR